MKFIPVTEARGQLPELLASAERVALTRNGRPVGVLLRYDDYEALQAMLALAQKPQRLARILAGHARVQRGELDEFIDLDDLEPEEAPETEAVQQRTGRVHRP